MTRAGQAGEQRMDVETREHSGVKGVEECENRKQTRLQETPRPSAPVPCILTGKQAGVTTGVGETYTPAQIRMHKTQTVTAATGQTAAV